MWYRLAREILAEKHSGAIVALFLPKKSAQSVALADGDLPDGCDPEPSDNLHITLAYLGKADDLSDRKKSILSAIEDFAAHHPPIEGKVSGIGRFTGNGDKDAFYASFDSPDLFHFRHRLLEHLENHGVHVDETHGFTPHITLSYLPTDTTTPEVLVESEALKFSRLTVAWGGQKTHYPFER